jgi:thiamine biosynthesis lipoprotein
VLPTAGVLDRALARVGYRQIELDRENHRVRLLQAGVQIDLGGIGKGYAADAALLEIKRCGITRASVDAGGDFALGDPPPGQVGWKIGIASADPDGRPDCWLRLSNLAVATSGDLWQYIEIDGVRYSHLVDPRTGLGVTSGALATVVAGDCTSADCLASTVCILEPERGLKLVEELTAGGGRILTRADGRARTFQSPRFSQWLEDPLSGDAGGSRRTSAK